MKTLVFALAIMFAMSNAIADHHEEGQGKTEEVSHDKDHKHVKGEGDHKHDEKHHGKGKKGKKKGKKKK